MQNLLPENEIKALVSLIADDDPDIRDHVEERILSLGGSAIPFLESEWENTFSPDVQKRIEDLIHTLQFDRLKSDLTRWYLNGGENLLEGMWLIATYQYPDLEMEKLSRQIEQIYYEVWLEMRADIHPYDQVKLMNGVMFRKLRFGANTKNFHAPGNSMLNVVLESRKGNPIALCVVYLLVARRMKLPVYGVNLPNLFILTYKTENRQFYINVFNKGLIFSRPDIDNYLSNLNLQQLDIFYEPCSHVDIIRRVLRNLIVSFDKTGDADKVEEVKALLQCVSEPEDEANLF
ncbi:MAG: transglutaminase-like domain-containing protein [Bacteroidota bacterium]